MAYRRAGNSSFIRSCPVLRLARSPEQRMRINCESQRRIGTIQEMPTLDDVYQKFGFVAEAAQLLETELGSLLLLLVGVEENLISVPNPALAAEVYEKIDKHTLGQLITKLKAKDKGI